MSNQINTPLQNSNNLSNLTVEQRERARALGITDVALRVRLSRGWSAERATGQLATLRMPDGQRQRYRAPPRGKWGNLWYHVSKDKAEADEVEAVCANEGLPVPIYSKPSRRTAYKVPVHRVPVDPLAGVPKPPAGPYDPDNA